ncbi:MAG TPA: AbrB/MazE/SpoVT family DNA-binding domain-containing protein [Bryobacteraceae bacterium]|jgi:antitoxin PrlF|nr:AbrB/MazE/SpoVT family DNA-binding domain-containing protein [Bryobacteraceae bacterium]
MPSSTITSKGQVTVPKEIRERLRLKPGDRVDFVVGPAGRITLKAIDTDIRSLRGILKSKRKQPLSIEEMNQVIARGYAGLL